MSYTIRYIMVVMMMTVLVSSVSGQDQTIVLDSFNRLKTLGDVVVELVHGDEYKATYAILKGFEHDLSFENKEGQLFIRVNPPKGSKYNRLVTKARVTLTYKELRDIDISAMSEVRSTDTLQSPFLKIRASKGGRGRFVLNVFDVKLETRLRGSLSLQGKTQTLKIESLTNSVITADNFFAKEVDVIAADNSRVNIRCERAIYGKSSSGAAVLCIGSPTYKNIDDRDGGKFVVRE